MLLLSTALLCTAPATADALLQANHAITQRVAESPATVTSRYDYSGQGLKGRITSVVDPASGNFLNASDIGPIQDSDGFDGRVPWMRDVAGTYLPQNSDGKRALAVNQAYRNADLWWRPDHGGAQVETIGCGGLRITPPGGAPFEAWFDPQTALLSRTREPGVFGITIELRYAGYEKRQNRMVPTRIERVSADEPSTLETMRLADRTRSPARPRSAYAMPVINRTQWSLPRSGETAVPFRLLNNHIIVDVRIDGKGPFPFMVDTGGHNIVTPGTLAALGMRQSGAALAGGGGETIATNGYAHVDTIELAGAQLRDQTVLAQDFSPVDVEGISLGGMLGLEFLDHFVTRIDYGTMTLTVLDPERFDADRRADAGTRIPFEFYEHIPQAQGTIDGRKARFNIDTGSRSDVTLTTPFVEHEDLHRVYPDGRVMNEGWGVGGATRSHVTRAGSLTLGPVTIPRPIAGLSASRRNALSDRFYEGNVGSGILKRFVVTFDYPRQAMYLSPLDTPDPDTGQLDRTGMWLNLDKDGFRIMDIVADSPTAIAGLQVGDVVTAIGERSSADISLSDARRTLKLLPVAQPVVLSFQRGELHKRVTVVPRKLIPD